MSNSIITVENLSKKYIISRKEAGNYTALRDVIVNGAKSLLGKGKQKNTKEEFWALKDINFEIKQGDRVGIIGRNGAGKSTLLKILSRITEPTKGKIHLRGRVASLLEVGTGFHPELTGRENIYLNGAIMGMSKWEIKKKFDEIVAFAEVEKFLDTPVKRYSSGMYVRLAFAVAAHLEPEILVIDEVLAVGDAQFQKKCLGKMEEAGKEGRTVLFVSHDMGIISRICKKCLLLKGGFLSHEGTTLDVIDNYNKSMLERPLVLDFCKREQEESLAIVFKKIWLEDYNGKLLGNVNYRESFFICFEVQINKSFNYLAFQVGVSDNFNSRVFTADSEENGFIFKPKSQKKAIIKMNTKLSLMPGTYTIAKIMVRTGKIEINTILNIMNFEVSNISSKGAALVNTGKVFGDSKWESIVD